MPSRAANYSETKEDNGGKLSQWIRTLSNCLLTP
jgi:hypothetical protein